jgi:hypothetical protein
MGENAYPSDSGSVIFFRETMITLGSQAQECWKAAMGVFRRSTDTVMSAVEPGLQIANDPVNGRSHRSISGFYQPESTG